MPLADLLFHPLARKDFRAARDWYGRQSLDAALRFSAAVDKALERVARAPESCAIEHGNYRRVRVSRFPYVVIFRPRHDGVLVIVAVAHTSRRPGYWRRRI